MTTEFLMSQGVSCNSKIEYHKIKRESLLPNDGCAVQCYPVLDVQDDATRYFYLLLFLGHDKIETNVRWSRNALLQKSKIMKAESLPNAAHKYQNTSQSALALSLGHANP